MTARTTHIKPRAPRGAWSQTASGRAFDLIEPSPAMVHWPDIAEGLAKAARFNGQTPGVTFSVAQHCILGADYLEDRAGPEAALAFLLHDAHEAFLGDLPTPVKRALAEVAERSFPGRGAGEITRQAWKELVCRLDAAIYCAAGMAWPLPPNIAAIVKEIDASMLVTERARLMRTPPFPWGAEIEAATILPIRGKFSPLSAGDAQIQWLKRLARYRPNLITR